MGNRVTIKDVAREANVSIKTVSNVLNDTGSMRPDTRRRVEEVMRKLGYTVNISARAMRSGGTKLIGLNIFDFSQPFVPIFTDKVIEYAKERHYGVVINTYGSDGEGLVASVDESYRLGAEGWILFVMSPLADEGAVLEQPYPIVTTGDHLAYGKSDWITMPNIESISTVVGRFLDEGAQTVALMGVLPELVDEAVLRRQTEGAQALRAQGYVKAFEERGLSVNWRYVIPAESMNQREGMRVTKAMLDKLPCPDVVVCLNDAIALGAIHELQRCGLHVPDDVQVVGFDNVPEAEYSVPALTTIDPHIDDYAKHAVTCLSTASKDTQARPVRTPPISHWWNVPQLDLPTSIQQVRIGFVRSVCLLEQCGVSRWVAKLERGVGVLGGQCGEDEQRIALGGRFRFGHGLDLRAGAVHFDGGGGRYGLAACLVGDGGGVGQ